MVSMRNESYDSLASRLTTCAWISGILLILLVVSCGMGAYASISYWQAESDIASAIADSPPIIEVERTECAGDAPRPSAICATAWWYPTEDVEVAGIEEGYYHPSGYAEMFEILDKAPEYTGLILGGLPIIGLFYVWRSVMRVKRELRTVQSSEEHRHPYE